MSSEFVAPAESRLSPAAVVPAQFLGRSRGPGEGERRLLLALLEQAIGSYRKHATATDKRGRRAFAEVEAWLAGEEREAPFSFEAVCDHLELDPGYIRAELARWRQRQAAQRNPQAMRLQPHAA